MNDKSSGKRLYFRFFPEVRLARKYPWQIWIIGWIAIIKSCFWLFTDPVISDTISASVLKILGYKHLVYMVPFLICGIGVWNLRKWAVWGVILLAVTELFFFAVYPVEQEIISVHRNR